MQVTFFRQHFGSMAIGLSNADEVCEERRKHMYSYHGFFKITEGGISHPWTSDSWEQIRVSIFGENLMRSKASERNGFAKAEFKVNGKMKTLYLTHRGDFSQTLEYGTFSEPRKMAEKIIERCRRHIGGEVRDRASDKWTVVETVSIPKQAKVSLDKVSNIVRKAVAQGPEFFRDSKPREISE